MKAIEILIGLRQAKSYDENYPTDCEIKAAIAELEALQQPNSCSTCKNVEKVDSFLYCKTIDIRPLNCDFNGTFEVYSYFCCNRYEAKDEQ